MGFGVDLRIIGLVLKQPVLSIAAVACTGTHIKCAGTTVHSPSR